MGCRTPGERRADPGRTVGRYLRIVALGMGPTRTWGWPEEIGHSIQLRRQVHAREGDLSPFTIPFEAAGEAELAATEARLGASLDALHRGLLARANGWEQFFTFMHLLSCAALGRTRSGSLSGDAQVILDTFFEGGAPVDGLPGRDDLLIIAANPAESADILALWRVGPLSGGGRPVSWIAEGEEVERFDNCWQLLVSVDAYLQSDLTIDQSPPRRH